MSDDALNYASLVVELKQQLDQKEKVIADLTNQIEITKRMPVPTPVIIQVAQQKEKIQKLESDLAYYKSHVDKQVIINRQNEKSIRKNQFARK
jgi:CRISPR/Cas system-associated exonuclease Cas4 (RecB family)